MASQKILIAGQHGGKFVKLVPTAKPIYDRLDIAAKAGSHWARLAVSGLRALSSGRLDKNNIFVRPGPSVRNGKEQFYVILPGCKAIVEREPDDTYSIVDLVLDSGYMDLNNQNMAGLYKATKLREDWSTTLIENGKITPDGSQTIVGVSDTRYDNSDRAASKISEFIGKAPGANSGSFFKEFQMHFTPGKSTLGGVMNYRQAANPLDNQAILGSAQVLARTMLRAKKQSGITWVSEFGGAAVLTQAMKILVDQGVTLEQHTAYLYRPNTNVEEAVTWALKLNMQMERKFSTNTPLDFMGNRNQIGLIKRRLKSDDSYKVGHAGFDLAYQVAGVSVAAGMATTALSLGGVPMGLGAAAPMMATIVAAFAGTAATCTTVLGGLALGDSLLEQHAPSFHSKHIGSYK